MSIKNMHLVRVLAITLGANIVFANAQTQDVLIAPMLARMDVCEEAIHNPDIHNEAEATQYCLDHNLTSSQTIEKKLSELGAKKSVDGKYSLGYVLVLPLLSIIFNQSMIPRF